MERHMRVRHLCLVLASIAAGALLAAGCTQSQPRGGSAGSESAKPAHTMLPAGTKTAVTFQFTDVAVASGGGHLLRLGFTMNNGSGDPQLCDSSLFSLQLSDGTVLDADASANAQCDPDM